VTSPHVAHGLSPRETCSENSVNELVELCLSCGAEEIFAEPVNARGPGLRRVQEALLAAGFVTEAEAIGSGP